MTEAFCTVCKTEKDAKASLMRCSGCKADENLYCSVECQKKDWPLHKKRCKEVQNARKPASQQIIKTVDVLGGNNQPFNVRVSSIKADHPMFTAPGLEKRICPISKLVQVPIVIWRQRTDDPMSHLYSNIRATLDNQSVTFMMVDPYTGWAPMEWQQGIGPVTIARLDKKPLTVGDLETIWMFCDECAEVASERGRSAVEKRYTVPYFQNWCQRYAENNPRGDRTLPL